MSWLDRFRRKRREADRDLMADLLQERDEALAAAIGRPLPEGIATPSEEFARRVVPDFDRLWLHNGVLVFEPTPEEPYWAYVTAGLSTPWHLQDGEHLSAFSPAEPSAAGYEISMTTKEFTDWPIGILNVLMLYGLGAWSGRSASARPLKIGERIPLQSMGLRFPGTSIEGLITMPAPFKSTNLTIRSGYIHVFHVLGLTKEEYAWLMNADRASHAKHIAQLGTITDFSRVSADWARGSKMPADITRLFSE